MIVRLVGLVLFFASLPGGREREQVEGGARLFVGRSSLGLGKIEVIRLVDQDRPEDASNCVPLWFWDIIQRNMGNREGRPYISC